MISLPKIEHPIYRIKIPSIGKDHSFRPFLVKEEKLLLMAKESNNNNDIFISIKQVINNCSLDSNLNIDKLSIFDLEYIFLRLRAFSVDNIVKVSYRDYEDDELYDFEVELDKVEVKFPENKNNVIKINENTGIIMKYPSASLYSDEDFLNLEKEHLFKLIVKCIDKIYYGEEVYDAKDIKQSELEEFLENLSVGVFKEVNDFLKNVPKLEYVIKYTNKKGSEREIYLNSLNDFFTWR